MDEEQYAYAYAEQPSQARDGKIATRVRKFPDEHGFQRRPPGVAGIKEPEQRKAQMDSEAVGIVTMHFSPVPVSGPEILPHPPPGSKESLVQSRSISPGSPGQAPAATIAGSGSGSDSGAGSGPTGPFPVYVYFIPSGTDSELNTEITATLINWSRMFDQNISIAIIDTKNKSFQDFVKTLQITTPAIIISDAEIIQKDTFYFVFSGTSQLRDPKLMQLLEQFSSLIMNKSYKNGLRPYLMKKDEFVFKTAVKLSGFSKPVQVLAGLGSLIYTIKTGSWH